MKTKELQHYILDLLETKLPPHLYYHNKEHTQYVMNAARQLATAEKVCEHKMELLLTAALLHDVGFIRTVKNHEDASCDIAKKLLPSYEYDAAAIEAICELIMVTKLPQQAHTPLAYILCDADLYYLGTDKFFDLGEKLFKEMSALHLIGSQEEWDELQVQFLSSHHYYTAAANRLLYEKKLANLFTLKARMRHY
ncbi:HD domain-containing protein [Ilyomonas limi]|uniref:HD domain-containing protein n=1 Tax=Ilyomonas limi TaxID=2575867 RepID=A0A4U3KY79_9BACT|nr:HD domain-containing protein [Ilyomonas limi]TKK67440.1 HD domain-containing protein [Ilyomonas limi]